MKFMLGMNRVTYDMEYSQARRKQVNDEENPQFNFATGEQYVWGDKDWNAQLGYFGRFNYDYAGRYLLVQHRYRKFSRQNCKMIPM